MQIGIAGEVSWIKDELGYICYRESDHVNNTVLVVMKIFFINILQYCLQMTSLNSTHIDFHL